MTPNKAYFSQESEKFIFRKMTVHDVEIWSDFFRKNDRLAFLGIDSTESPIQLAHNWIQKQLDRYEEYGLGHLAVFKKNTNEFVGVAGLLPKTIEDKLYYEVAYSLLPRFWGKGYATEIARQIKDFALEQLGIDEMISIIHLNNTDSAKVAIKNDMVIWKHTDYKMLPVHIYRYKRVRK